MYTDSSLSVFPPHAFLLLNQRSLSCDIVVEKVPILPRRRRPGPRMTSARAIDDLARMAVLMSLLMLRNILVALSPVARPHLTEQSFCAALVQLSPSVKLPTMAATSLFARHISVRTTARFSSRESGLSTCSTSIAHSLTLFLISVKVHPINRQLEKMDQRSSQANLPHPRGKQLRFHFEELEHPITCKDGGCWPVFKGN